MKNYTEQDIAEMSEQIKQNIAEGRRLGGEIQHKLDERDAIVAALRAVGIEVNSEPARPVNYPKPARLADRLKRLLRRHCVSGKRERK